MNQQNQIRYDRQIRLWGDEGQSSIQQARICVFGSSALASEILKSLVLAGIGSFHIIDDALMNEADFGKNFFIEENSLGKYKGECLVRQLTELNPSVHGQHSPIPLKKFSKHDYQMLTQFSLVIGTNLTANEAIQLDNFLFERNIPFVYARVYGMLGHLRLSFQEHIVWNSHRLDSPFPQLLKMAKETDLTAMTHEQHSHTPYLLLYFKAIDIWKERQKTNHRNNNEEQMEADLDSSSFPDISNYKIRKEFEKILMEMRQPDDKGSLEEENFAEAKRNLLKSMGRTKIPDNIEKVLADPKADPSPEPKSHKGNNSQMDEQFWILCAALREFIARNQQMPLSGQLPDMTSDSKRYIQLLNIYRAKSKADAAQLQILANEIIKIRSGFSAHSQGTATATSSSSYVPTTEATSSTYETDESITDETDEDDLSRMSTTEANEQRISISMEDSMEEEQHTEEESNYISNAVTATSSITLTNGMEMLTVEQCQNFCKNASKIGIQYGASLSSEFAQNLKSILHRMEPPQLEEVPPRIDPLAWYVLLRAVDRFRAANERIPTEVSDLRDLKRCVSELFAETKDPELIARQNDLIPADVMQEVCRFGAAEPHVVAAILGGCVAQEVIKLCTHQYVPVDNSIIFDGHSQQATSFRVIKQ